MGLPSGTKWATQNVGAKKPSDAGLYFQWGDTSGYTADQVGKDKQFYLYDYKWYLSGSGGSEYAEFTKYTTKNAVLELEDDAAHVNMGGDWHMPSPVQITELLNNTTSIWTTQDGVNGRLFTAKNDKSKSIFIPAAGMAADGLFLNIGEYGYVWSSTRGDYPVLIAQILGFSSEDIGLDQNAGERNAGLSIRGVIG